jgi:hypothetical protein
MEVAERTAAAYNSKAFSLTFFKVKLLVWQNSSTVVPDSTSAFK